MILPSSGRSQSSPCCWQTICVPWCRWLRSWGFRTSWSNPPGASCGEDPSSQSWSATENEPGRAENNKNNNSPECQQKKIQNDRSFAIHTFKACASSYVKKILPFSSECPDEIDDLIFSLSPQILPFLRRSSRRSGLVDLRRKEGIQRPSRTSGHQGPTNQQPCCNPRGMNERRTWLSF